MLPGHGMLCLMTNDGMLDGTAAMDRVSPTLAAAWKAMQESPNAANLMYWGVFNSLDVVLGASETLTPETAERTASFAVARRALYLATISVTLKSPSSWSSYDADVSIGNDVRVEFSQELRKLRNFVHGAQWPLLDAALAVTIKALNEPQTRSELEVLREMVACAGVRCLSAFLAHLGALAVQLHEDGLYVPALLDPWEFDEVRDLIS